MVRYLCEHGADVDACDKESAAGIALLCHAVCIMLAC